MAQRRKRKTGARVTAQRYAGANDRGVEHAVTTVEGGRGDLYRRTPCPTCPWRKDAVGEFPAEAFRRSAQTAYDVSMHTFACHSSGQKRPATCAGFLLSSGAAHNLSVRLKQRDGKLDLNQVSDGGVELFGCYRDMAVANGVDPGEDILKPMR